MSRALSLDHTRRFELARDPERLCIRFWVCMLIQIFTRGLLIAPLLNKGKTNSVVEGPSSYITTTAGNSERVKVRVGNKYGEHCFPSSWVGWNIKDVKPTSSLHRRALTINHANTDPLLLHILSSHVPSCSFLSFLDRSRSIAGGMQYALR